MACAALYWDLTAICSVGVEAEPDHLIYEWKDIRGVQEQEDY